MIWSIGGLGMGMATSTLGVLLLDQSATDAQGANSAAMQISDSIAESLALAIGAVTFAILLTVDSTTAYARGVRHLGRVRHGRAWRWQDGWSLRRSAHERQTVMCPLPLAI